MSVRKEIYNTVAAKLATLNKFDWIDLYKGQLNNKNDSYPTGFPVAFISIGRIAYEDMTMNVQEGRVTIDLYLFFNKGGDTFIDATDKDTSLKILDTLDTTVNAIQWIATDCFTDISQTGEEDLTERYQRPAYKLSFSTIVYNRLKYPNYVSN
ncbi:hypothetical protein PL373_07985 [Tenacibaculum maritimum]|nr:hypothetical protein [Tenacibaculum maritimum]MDB0601085.1 hypothetical protein [Tenacibaculum maritimum]MDB0612166.1 hypothetical protein [Tenacibaculum maritimum]